MGNPKQLGCLLHSFQDYNFSDGSSGQIPGKTETLHQQLLHVTLLSYNKVHLSPLCSFIGRSKVSMEFHVKPEEIRQTTHLPHLMLPLVVNRSLRVPQKLPYGDHFNISAVF